MIVMYTNPDSKPAWKASGLLLRATFDELWANLGYSGLLFWATWFFQVLQILTGAWFQPQFCHRILCNLKEEQLEM